MARELKTAGIHTITLWDPVEKAEVVFSHRMPGTEERLRYMVGRYKRQGTKLIDRTRSALIDAAASVLAGIRTGDFTIDGVPLSSTEGEEGYRDDWKELVRDAAGDLLFLMGHELFEGRISLTAEEQQGLEIVGEFDPSPSPLTSDASQEDIPPLATSSGA